MVGGCDVRTHELAFISLEQHGLFDSWKKEKAGVIPGEGAAFLVLEGEPAAAARGARVYARLGPGSFCASHTRSRKPEALFKTLSGLGCPCPAAVVAAGEDDPATCKDEAATLETLGIKADATIYPKRHLGNLFAAAAPLQVALAALLTERFARPVLANCFGYGSEPAAFVLEKA